MFSKFLSLKREKQDRILNAAIKEFTQKGFKNASTDKIVKDANISKGSLFHYFNNKKDLFLFLYDYSLEILMDEFFGEIDLNETDLLARFRQLVLLKVELVKKYPDMFDFIKVAYFEESEDVKRELEHRNKEKIAISYEKVLEDIDVSKFREDIDHKRAINMVVWTLEGFSKQEQEKARHVSLSELHLEDMVAEMDYYLELLRKCLYKECS
ncbi:TetR/AcrR family transcriptional regulator [Ectobacillus panaciterrae]|uniref:TetR/AcrR family transcriptional regulator n=1 Tax=Ectobacillus panaciterrae TaxID=363872 RepID=UPI00040E4A19|nr:TetR/AcrR family transcriptional regulator [Ectobacillus panaciterrae]